MTSLAVAVSTHNRADVREQCLTEWRRRLPTGAVLFLVDDASTPPAAGADVRFDVNAGIARTKNACLTLLVDSGADALWLTDDDTWPVTDDWWQPYTTSGVPHLAFLRPQPPAWTDGRLWSSTTPGGWVLYVQRHVVERVGGMRTEFGRHGGEHGEWSRRIHNCGYTPHPFMDVVGSDRIWRSVSDTTASTVSAEAKAANDTHRRTLKHRYWNTTNFVPYRETP